jgi:hypothetical protein
MELSLADYLVVGVLLLTLLPHLSTMLITLAISSTMAKLSQQMSAGFCVVQRPGADCLSSTSAFAS